jgi:hypothetical protein
VNRPTGEHPTAAFKRLDSVRRRLDEDAFEPSPVIERLVLQVIGGWELVKAEIYFHSFAAAGFGAEWSSEKIVKAMKKIATAAHVRYPHEQFAAAANDANDVRDDSLTC